MNLNEMTNEELLEAFAKDTQDEELKAKILEIMNDEDDDEDEDEDGYDSEGRAEEELDALDVKVKLVDKDNAVEREYGGKYDKDLDLSATLLHEHGYESQMAVYFNEEVLNDMQVGDELIVTGKFVSAKDNDDEIGEFTITITKNESLYSMSLDSDGFYYELA